MPSGIYSRARHLLRARGKSSLPRIYQSNHHHHDVDRLPMWNDERHKLRYNQVGSCTCSALLPLVSIVKDLVTPFSALDYDRVSATQRKRLLSPSMQIFQHHDPQPMHHTQSCQSYLDPIILLTHESHGVPVKDYQNLYYHTTRFHVRI